MSTFDPELVEVAHVTSRKAVNDFQGVKTRGIEHEFEVVDRNFPSRNVWRFALFVPNEEGDVRLAPPPDRAQPQNLVGPGAPVHPVRAVHAAEVSREVLRTGRSVRSLRNEDAPGSQERRPPPSFSRVLPPSDEGAGHDLQSKRREALGRRVRPRGLLRDGSAFRCRTGVDPDRRILPR